MKRSSAGGATGATLALACSFVMLACTGTKTVAAPDGADSGVAPDAAPAVEEPTTIQGKAGTLFGKPATSYAKVNAENIVVAVGVTFELASLTTDAPKSHPFQDDLVLEMPAVAKEQTILNHLRANWLVQGHGPAPYAEPHFDFHFLRGTIAEVDDTSAAPTCGCPRPTSSPRATARRRSASMRWATTRGPRPTSRAARSPGR